LKGKHDTASQLLNKYANGNWSESSLIKSLTKKMTNSVLFGSGRRPTWSCRHCSVQWRVARSRYLNTHSDRRYTL